MSTTVILFIILALLGSYLIGCLQPSYLLGKAIKHVDIRDYGSGNSGATNAIRV
ncbi:MAG: glycerol-3-phosphate acyltransferase, partial [Clostridia bacterium]|nr:glycerol-3-phosphate acyltransferase [Clostridia bacterium]